MNFSGQPLGPTLIERNRARLLIGATLSLILHAFFVSLQFGTPGLGLPGFELPWIERRAQTPELTIRIANVRAAPNPAPGTVLPTEPTRSETALPAVPATGTRVTLPSQALKRAAPTTSGQPSAAPPQPQARRVRLKSPTPVISKKEANPDSFVLPSASPEEPEQEIISKAETVTEAVTETVTDTQNPPPEVANRSAPQAAPAKPEEPPASVNAEAPASAPEQKEQEAATRAQEIEAKKQEDASARRLRAAAEAAAREMRNQAEQAARQQAAALALQRHNEQKLAEQEQAHQEQARSERRAAELDARKQAEENARQQAAALDRQKRDELAARERAQEAQERANRQKADALAAQQREHDRNAAATPAADSAGAATNDKAPASASLPANLLGGAANRVIEQARKSDLPRSVPPRTAETERRRSVFGSIDQDIGVAMYIDSWRQKIERTGNMNYRPSAREGAREDPVITVSIRSDGSVEDIAFVRSSGLPELDDAVRRIVRLYARYSAFPPDLARRYDVIEIRRVWRFDDKLTIREELR